MKLNKDIFLYTVEDKLVTNKKFNIYSDLKLDIAWTDIGNEKDLSKYYRSEKYDSFKKTPLTFFDYLYNFVQNLMLRYKWLIIKKFISGKFKSLDIGAGLGVFAKFCLNLCSGMFIVTWLFVCLLLFLFVIVCLCFVF